MNKCISFKFWSSVLSKPSLWFFLEQNSGSLSVPRDKRSSSGHLCSYMTGANGQSGPRAPEQMFTSVSLCKRKLGTSNKKPDEDFSAPINIERGPPGDSFEVTLLDAEWAPKSYVLGQTCGSLQPFYFQFLISPIDLWDAFWSLYCYLLIPNIIIFWHLPWT